MTRVLVTGGCGFIGSNFIKHLLLEDSGVEVTNLDLLTYAGNPRNLEGVGAPGYRFVRGDVRDPKLVDELVTGADWIVHFAAETHVDRSTSELAGDFVRTNVHGTYTLLDSARRLAPRQGLELFLGLVAGEQHTGKLVAHEADVLSGTGLVDPSLGGLVVGFQLITMILSEVAGMGFVAPFNFAGIRLELTHHDLQQRRLADSVRTHDREPVTASHQ